MNLNNVIKINYWPILNFQQIKCANGNDFKLYTLLNLGYRYYYRHYTYDKIKTRSDSKIINE